MSLAFPTTLMDREIVQMIEDLPDFIILDAPDGRTLRCTVGDSTEGVEVKEEGVFRVCDISVVVRTALLFDNAGNPMAISPRAKFSIKSTGTRYRLAKLNGSQDGLSITLHALQVTS